MRDLTKISGWLGMIAAILSVAGSIVGCTLWVSRRFNDMDARMAKMESAIKVLNSEPTQSQEYRDLIKDLLAVSQGQQRSYGSAFEGRNWIQAQRNGVSADAPAAQAPAAAPPKP